MDNDITRQRCSFCGKAGKRGDRFAGGLGAMVCETCVGHFHDMFASSRRTEEASEPPWDRMTDAELLAAIPEIARTADQVDEFLVEWVELARSRKISWAQIGKAMGVSRQAAWERFAQRVESVRSSSTA